MQKVENVWIVLEFMVERSLRGTTYTSQVITVRFSKETAVKYLKRFMRFTAEKRSCIIKDSAASFYNEKESEESCIFQYGDGLRDVTLFYTIQEFPLMLPEDVVRRCYESQERKYFEKDVKDYFATKLEEDEISEAAYEFLVGSSRMLDKAWDLYTKRIDANVAYNDILSSVCDEIIKEVQIPPDFRIFLFERFEKMS